MVEPAEPRRRAAEALGATPIDPAANDPIEVVRAVTGGLGADAALEAVGIPATFELCTQLVRPGGHIANIGVHGKPATLHLESLWIRNVTVTTGLVDARTTPTLLRLLAAGQLDVTSLVTHRFRMDDFLGAYETFADPAQWRAEGADHRRITAAARTQTDAPAFDFRSRARRAWVNWCRRPAPR